MYPACRKYLHRNAATVVQVLALNYTQKVHEIIKNKK